MRFIVLPSSSNPLGLFYSPEYSITNNGSKTLEMKINDFKIDESTPLDENETLLHIGKIDNSDKNTQMELKLSTIDDSNKDIDLTQVTTLTDEQKKLFNLEQNETKKIKFSAEKWELPKNASKKENAKSNFTAEFEFSIEESNLVE